MLKLNDWGLEEYRHGKIVNGVQNVKLEKDENMNVKAAIEYAKKQSFDDYISWNDLILILEALDVPEESLDHKLMMWLENPERINSVANCVKEIKNIVEQHFIPIIEAARSESYLEGVTNANNGFKDLLEKSRTDGNVEGYKAGLNDKLNGGLNTVTAEAIEEGRRLAIAELKEKLNYMRDNYRDFIIDEIQQTLFGPEPKAQGG